MTPGWGRGGSCGFIGPTRLPFRGASVPVWNTDDVIRSGRILLISIYIKMFLTFYPTESVDYLLFVVSCHKDDQDLLFGFPFSHTFDYCNLCTLGEWVFFCIYIGQTFS